MLIGIDASRANRTYKSGVEWYAYHLITSLYKIDFNNQYFLYSEKELENSLKPRSENFKERLVKWPFGRFWTLGGLSLEMLNRKPDVLFIPSHTFPLLVGKKNIITWHDVGYEYYPETYSKWELTSLKQGAKGASKKADKIIAVSQFTKEEIMKFYNVSSEKIEVIHLGCNHERFKVEKQEDIKKFLEEEKIDLPYFVYLGRLSLRKNIVGLIRSYNSFREKIKQPHKLILVGSQSVFQNEIDEEIRESPYRNEIKKVGWLSIDKIPFLLSGARALVLPSIYEGFGLPVIEAMACGCPVIASTSGSLPEIVDEAGLLVDAHDIEGFAQNMLKVVEDQQLRQSLIDKGLARAQEFNWDKCARKTLEVITST